MTNRFNSEAAQDDLLILDRPCKTCGYSKVKLSPRESYVYHCLANGLTALQTGDLMQLSPKTVATYKSRIRDKLDLGRGAIPLHTSILLHYAKERTIVIKERQEEDNIPPEFFAGYLQAMKDFASPDIRLITGQYGITDDRKAMPPVPTR